MRGEDLIQSIPSPDKLRRQRKPAEVEVEMDDEGDADVGDEPMDEESEDKEGDERAEKLNAVAEFKDAINGSDDDLVTALDKLFDIFSR
jgi:hypothetical protein